MESQSKILSKFHPNPSLKLMDQVREVLRYYHYAYRTEQAYCQWIRRYIHYSGGRTHRTSSGRAAAQAGLDKKVGCHTLRHSFATHMLENGVHIRVLQNSSDMPMSRPPRSTPMS